MKATLRWDQEYAGTSGGGTRTKCFALTMRGDGGIGGSFLPGLELQKGLEREDLASLGWKTQGGGLLFYSDPGSHDLGGWGQGAREPGA